MYSNLCNKRRSPDNCHYIRRTRPDKCLYLPFYLDQAPLTWLESLDKDNINKWAQPKMQFTRNFAGAMGYSGTHMDLVQL
jgi:hypothetical protein